MEEMKFNVSQILSDPRFAPRADALRIILTEEAYTLAEVEEKLEKFMKRRVR